LVQDGEVKPVALYSIKNIMIEKYKREEDKTQISYKERAIIARQHFTPPLPQNSEFIFFTLKVPYGPGWGSETFSQLFR